jgi:hypothetical protein
MTFPASPVNGETTAVNGISYVYDSTSNTWTRIPTSIDDIQANLGTATTNITTLFSNAATQATSINSVNANIGAYQTYANANLGTATTNITTLFSNAATQATALSTIDANIGAYQIYANANAATQATSIDSINANVGAYQTYANTNTSTQSTTINTINANIGAYQIYANANAAAQTTSIDSINANVGSYQIYANSNAATQATSIDSINANLGAYQTYANANAATQTTTINSIDANIGAYQTYANTNAATQTTSINSIDANIGAYQTYANANAITQATSIDTINSNVTAANSSINTFNANLGAFETYANTKIGTNTDGNLVVVANTASTDATTGALVVRGGVGIGGDMNIAGNIVPAANVAYDLGSSTNWFRDLWLSSGTIHIGGAQISQDSGTGAVVIIPQITQDNPNPVATIFSPTGAVTSANTASGTVSSADVAAAIETNDFSISGRLTANTATVTNDMEIGGNLTIVGVGDIRSNLGNATTNITTLFGNAASQEISITSLATGANANTAAYLPSVTTLAGLTSFGAAAATTTAQGSLTVIGNLTVQGNTLTIGSNNLTVTDSIIDLHTFANLAPLTSNDGRDVGIRLHYYKTSDKHAFIGWENATEALTYYQDATETNGVITGTLGNVELGSLYVSNTTAATSTTTGALQVRGGAGISGNVYANGLYVTTDIFFAGNNNRFTANTANFVFVTESTDDNVAYNIPYVSPSGTTNAYRQLYSDNTGVTFNPSTNTLTVTNISTSIITAAGGTISASGVSASTLLSTGGTLTASGNTASTSTTTGTFILTGGAGIGGQLWIRGTAGRSITATGTIAITGTGANLQLPNGATIKDTIGAAVAFGQLAGNSAQGSSAVAIGDRAAQYSQGSSSVAIGVLAGNSAQGTQSVAVGYAAGWDRQGGTTVAVGYASGQITQSTQAVAVGSQAGFSSQGNAAIAIGALSGQQSQGRSAVAIGYAAGYTSQGNNSIILNATGAVLDQTTANTFTVAPVRNDVANVAQVLFYNTTSKEVTYGNTISVAGNINASQFNFSNGVNILSTITAGSTYSNVNVEAYIGGNIGSYQIYANANAATQTTSIDSINANIGAYQTYANANIGGLATSIDSINSNVTAANSAIQTLSANIGTLVAGAPGALDTLLELANALGNNDSFSSTMVNWLGNITSNVTAANSSINTFNANLGAYQTYANTKIGTNTNGNLVVVATTESTNTTTGALVVAGGIGVTGNVVANTVYTTTGIRWAGNGVAFSSGGAGLTYTANIAPPSSGNVTGDQWYNTTTNVLYEYLNDGTSKYWVDIQSPTIANTTPTSTTDTLHPFLLAGM